MILHSERLIPAGLLFRQSEPPDANYLFKHALVRDAAYSTLLREPRRALHARIAEVIENQFADIAVHQPELLARHCTEAGLVEKAAKLWGRAGQRSLKRAALMEAVEQLTRALTEIEKLPATAALRFGTTFMASTQVEWSNENYASSENSDAVRIAMLCPTISLDSRAQLLRAWPCRCLTTTSL